MNRLNEYFGSLRGTDADNADKYELPSTEQFESMVEELTNILVEYDSATDRVMYNEDTYWQEHMTETLAIVMAMIDRHTNYMAIPLTMTLPILFKSCFMHGYKAGRSSMIVMEVADGNGD